MDSIHATAITRNLSSLDTTPNGYVSVISRFCQIDLLPCLSLHPFPSQSFYSVSHTNTLSRMTQREQVCLFLTAILCSMVGGEKM